MRQSPRVHLLCNADEVPYGLFAEADFCSEHENGLRDLHQFMGCGSPQVEGIERYMPSRARVDAGDFVVMDKRSVWTNGNRRKKTTSRTVLGSRANIGGECDGFYMADATFLCQFSDRNFQFTGLTDEAEELLHKIERHARSGDVMVMMGGLDGNPFNRGGLLVAIASMVSEKDRENVRAAHENARLLAEAADATGIKKRLDTRKGSHFDDPYRLYAMSPAWATTLKSRSDGVEVKTEHPVVFFINNGRSIYGWYTVEELDAWIAGHGKVLEDAAVREREREKRSSVA